MPVFGVAEAGLAVEVDEVGLDAGDDVPQVAVGLNAGGQRGEVFPQPRDPLPELLLL